MTERCKAMVWSKTSWKHYPCQRKATKGEYCWQHHPDTVAKRKAESDARYEAKWQNSPYRKLQRALEENEKLKRKIKRLEKKLRKKT